MKKLIAITLALLMSFSCFLLVSFAEETETAEHLTEVPEGYIGVYTIEDLYCVRNDLTANYILMKDIDLSQATAEGGDWNYGGRGWNPIGSDNIYAGNAFSGIFDGNGYAIHGLNINIVNATLPSGTNNLYLGVFAKVSGTIKNLVVKGKITLNQSARYSVKNYVGGIAGYCSGGIIENCINDVELDCIAPDHPVYAGGIVGYMESGTLNKCINIAKLSLNSSFKSTSKYTNKKDVCEVFVGGMTAYNNGTILNCINTGDISAFSNGGYSHWTSEGTINTHIVYYYNYCDVYASGIATQGTVTECYNTGSISATLKEGASYGGLYVSGITYYGSVTDCYNVGSSTGYSISQASASTCYFLEGTGKGSSGATQLTNGQMKLKSMYSGFDFDTVWTMEGRDDYPYPELRNTKLYFPAEDPTHKHSYITEITTPATHLTEGVETFTCSCGDSYTAVIEKIAEHNYELVVTPPTCTKQGYTTYSCGCGDTYVDNYVDASHNFVNGVCAFCGGVDTIISGLCGDNLMWILNTVTGELDITGTGSMWSWDGSSSNPSWSDFDSYVKTVTINDGVTNIGSYAFFSCNNLENAIIGNDVSCIGYRAFAGCNNLESVTFGDSVEEILGYAFWCCSSLKSVTFPDSLRRINSVYAFGMCSSLEKVTFGNGLTYIGELAFSGAPITELVIPNSVTYIGECAFWQCSDMKTIEIGSGLKTIDDGAFLSCTGVTNITVDKNNLYFSSDESGVLFNKEKTELIMYPAGNSRLSYTLPEGVITIGKSAFDCAESLTSIIIPKSVTAICSYAFYLSNAIIDVYYNGTEEQWNNIAIEENNECLTKATIHFNSCFENDNYKHNYVTLVKLPTCTEQGYTTYTCECGDTYVDNYVDATGHNYSSEITTPATHLTEGIETFTCDCGDTYTEVIEKIEQHDYESVVTSPTCTEKGYTIYTCECGDSYVSDYVDALGHSYTSTITKEATHTETGVLTYICDCGDTYTEEIAKTTEHNHISVITKEATHTATGVMTYTCACGDSYTEEIAKTTDHSYTSAITTPATHTATGIMTYTCECGDSYTEVIEKIADHSYNEVVTAPTCEEQGYTTYTCECGNSYVGNYVKPTGHNYETEVVAPTCTEQGYTTYTCTCGYSYVANYVNPLGHKYDSVVTAPTCTAQGYTTFTCACGDSYVGNYVIAKGHDYASVVTAPTCTEKGYTTYTCACGDSYVANYVNATGHSYTSKVTTPATHLTTGIMTYTCTCGDTYTEVIAKTNEHTYTSVTTAPTCENKGYTTYTCACGDTYIDNYVDATGHNANGDDVCDNCGETVEVENPSDNCSCNCHKSGISKFFFNFILFFQRLFGANKECACGVAHY